jgi:hypothetical protein
MFCNEVFELNDKLDESAIDEELRSRLYNSVYEEFVGPIDPASTETLDEFSSPLLRYHAGVLYPRDSNIEDAETKSDISSTDNSSEHPIIVSTESASTLSAQADIPDSSDVAVEALDGDFEEPVSLSNARAQSAMSMTIGIQEEDRLSVVVRCAKYIKQKDNGKSFYKRIPLKFVLSSDDIKLPSDNPGDTRHGYKFDEGRLELWLVYRNRISDGIALTVALCNLNRASSAKSEQVSTCYFQAGFKVTSSMGLLPPVWTQFSDSMSEEEASKRLIYRNIRNYAIGHGCATEWDQANPVMWAETKVMPTAETRPMKPVHPMMQGVSLSIEHFGQTQRWNETLASMHVLSEKYSEWIDQTRAHAEELPDRYHEAAQRNIEQCELCLGRINEGIAILENDDAARKAFVMANEAMYNQYLHYSVVSGERAALDEPIGYTRSWRPFQLAFILMNIQSITDETCADRKKVDLIWFPTGGGKTEAYLGLTAFTLIWERLTNSVSTGVTVFMRYTLRLLTSQQFDRASSLICALESMRRKSPDLLGNREFRIGLWVGSEASPNKRSDAARKRRAFADRGDGVNPFPVRKCPWCGCSLEENPRASYKLGANNRVRFICSNNACEFSKGDGLPLDVVDEEIYDNPPSLLVGTVDKFAMLPYLPEALPLFGITKCGRELPPKLIIQDELHLISGPLGSMAGHYETLISSICEREENGTKIQPKIVASTATVSRAKEQCNQLYACGEENVLQFPPSGIDYDDSFFSYEDKESRGRRYVGIFVPTLNAASTNIRLYADLLWEPATWKDIPDSWIDPYWTTIGYYGTTRELGQAVTWMGGDIPERLWEHKRRAERAGDSTVRYINVAKELTGRKDADEVRKGLDSLSVSYPSRDAVDLCFATNMISVGLDVGRLGLMVVNGQPKTTAEYIQATSRVGRGKAKGIVFVVYSTTKPRDRSHYENFAMYHKSFYQDVEPSSVTAFCRQVRDRALFGTLIGIYQSVDQDDQAFLRPEEEAFSTAEKEIIDRVEKVDSPEVEGTKRDIHEISKRWKSSDYDRWSELKPEGLDPQTPLMHPTGAKTSEDWSGGTFEVPTSMRNVDAQCKVRIIGSYSDYGEGEESSEDV